MSLALLFCSTIFVVHHRPFWTYESSLFQPIQAGKHSSLVALNMIGDDTGDNISSKNPLYCEMTAIYWAWKNRSPGDFVGFFHYRRYLNSNPSGSPLSLSNWRVSGRIPAESFIDEQAICELMREYDILLPHPLQFRRETIAQQYCKAHDSKSWNILEELLQELYPEHWPIVERTFNKHEGYMTNRFIMRDSLFQEYCDWIFPLLFELERRVPAQPRIYGFMAERLTTFFIEIQKEINKIKIKELPDTHILMPGDNAFL